MQQRNSLGRRQLAVLSRVAVDCTDPAMANKLVALLLPFLTRKALKEGTQLTAGFVRVSVCSSPVVCALSTAV